jgi:hypothetical protein
MTRRLHFVCPLKKVAAGDSQSALLRVATVPGRNSTRRTSFWNEQHKGVLLVEDCCCCCCWRLPPVKNGKKGAAWKMASAIYVFAMIISMLFSSLYYVVGLETAALSRDILMDGFDFFG